MLEKMRFWLVGNQPLERNNIALCAAGFTLLLGLFCSRSIYGLYQQSKDAAEANEQISSAPEGVTALVNRTAFATPQDEQLVKAALLYVLLIGALIQPFRICFLLAFAASMVAAAWVVYREITIPPADSGT
jgi:hypothetical protein